MVSKMFTRREFYQLVFSSSVLLSIKKQDKTNKLCKCFMHTPHTNKQKTQNGPSVSQLKISSDLSNDCKISPAFKKSCSSKLRKYNMVSNISIVKGSNYRKLLLAQRNQCLLMQNKNQN